MTIWDSVEFLVSTVLVGCGVVVLSIAVAIGANIIVRAIDQGKGGR